MKRLLRAGVPSFARSVATVMTCIAMSTASIDAGAASTEFSACSRCAGVALVWSDGDYDQIYLAAPVKDLANQHPKELSPEGLTDALLKLKRSGDEKAEPVFSPQQARKFADGLAAALAKANSRQDVLFFVTTSRGGTGWFAERRGYSGRAFIDDRGLNLIFGGAELDFIGQYLGTKRQPTFDFGSRESISAVSLYASGPSLQRRDWVAIPLAMMNKPRHAASQPSHGAEARKAAVTEEQYYAAQEMRLRRLRSLMEQDLITRDEYERKRKSILEEW